MDYLSAHHVSTCLRYIMTIGRMLMLDHPSSRVLFLTSDVCKGIMILLVSLILSFVCR